MGSLMNQSLSDFNFLKSSFLFAIVSVCIITTGCSTTTPLTSKPIPVVDSAVAAVPRGTYTVEMHPNLSAPKRYQGALTGNTTVSEALAESGAVKKFRSMEVEILRKVEQNGKTRGLKMPIDYQTNRKGPSPEQDYALLDGDRIVVRPKETSSILKMAAAVMGAR